MWLQFQQVYLDSRFSVTSMWPQVSCLCTPCFIYLIQAKQRPEKWDWTTTHILEWPKFRTVMTLCWWATGSLIHWWANPGWDTYFGRQFGSFLHNWNILSCDPEITTLGIYPSKLKMNAHTEACPYVFTAVLFIIVNFQKQPWCSSVGGEWMNKCWSCRQRTSVKP